MPSRIPALGLAVAALVAAEVRPAEATCSACCDAARTLVGWSADGRTWVTVRKSCTSSLEVHTAATIERFCPPASAQSDLDECEADAAHTLAHKATRRFTAAERVDVTRFVPLRRHRFIKFDRAWATGWKTKVELVAIPKARFKSQVSGAGGQVCSAWEVRRRAARLADRVRLAVIPRRCSEGELLSTTIAGAYLHPSGNVMLVKVKYDKERAESDEQFILVAL